MPIYKDNKGYFIVKICMNGIQFTRRRYKGKRIECLDDAKKCEKDLYTTYSEQQDDYKIDDLLTPFEEYLFKKFKETTAMRDLYTFKKRILPYFKGKTLSKINRSYMEYVCDSINGQDYKDVKGLIKIAKTFLNFLSTYGLDFNPNFLYVYKKNRIVFKRMNYYTLVEFEALISVIENSTDLLMFSMLFYYGLRCGELRGLQVRDFTKDRIYINKELTNKGRFGNQEILPVKTQSSIREYPYVLNIKELFNKVVEENKLKSTDYVFKAVDKNSLVIGETTIRFRLKKYAKLAKIKIIKIHEFRHSCATYLINKDVDPKDIAFWLGHSSVSTTLQTYAHILPIRKDNVKDIFNSIK